MRKVIVSDTSCLILLDKINRIDLLSKLFKNVTVTQIVADEFGNILPDFISIENPVNQKYQSILETFLDKGEASSIALCLEKDKCLLIIDELKGRREAEQLKIDITGTVGIFLLAKQLGYIDSVSTELQKLQKTNFRISDSIMEYAIKQAKE